MFWIMGIPKIGHTPFTPTTTSGKYWAGNWSSSLEIADCFSTDELLLSVFVLVMPMLSESLNESDEDIMELLVQREWMLYLYSLFISAS